ncbi:MAG TPA: hypothetical protein VHB77_09090, partial [Planctomycetaceae bacterium]|nr:hypothetical protein [Planctomycetaceae bacterium]
MKQEKGQIWIKAKPLRQQDLVNWKEATVILDAKTFLPQAVQLVEPDGALSVHTFFGLEQPDKRGLLDFRKLFPNDPLKLDIPKGYRLVSTNESAEPDRAGIAQIGPPLPPANKPKIQQAAHQKMAGFPALKQALETAQTADELEEARVLIGKIIERDKGATNPADRILTADHIKELSQVYQERRVELPRTPSRPGSR